MLNEAWGSRVFWVSLIQPKSLLRDVVARLSGLDVGHLVPLSLSLPVCICASTINVQTRVWGFATDEFQMKPPALSFTICVCAYHFLCLPLLLALSLQVFLSLLQPHNLTIRHNSLPVKTH